MQVTLLESLYVFFIMITAAINLNISISSINSTVW